MTRPTCRMSNVRVIKAVHQGRTLFTVTLCGCLSQWQRAWTNSFCGYL